MGGGFAYLLSHPQLLGATFLHPAWLLLLAALPLFLLGRKKLGGTASALRMGAALLVVLVLAGLRITHRLPDERLTLAVAIDVSESMSAEAIAWSQRYVNEAMRALAPHDEAGILTFAEDVEVLRAPRTAAALESIPLPRARGATDLAHAIDSAAALLPSDGQRRIVLITDGNESRGDGRKSLQLLSHADIRVDAVIPPTGERLDVMVDKLLAPALVAEESTFPIRLSAYNNASARPAVLSILFDGTMIDSTAIQLEPGTNTFEIPYSLRGRGAHRLRAQIETPEDAIPGNNFREVAVTVASRRSVLLITPRDSSLLQVVLARRSIDVHLRSPADFPRSLEELSQFNCVVLEDITADLFAPHAFDLLERYSRELGGGIVFAGGPSSYGDARLQQTALARLLPLTLEPRRPVPRTRDPLALMILIDRSNSMGYNSRIGTLRDGQKLRYAKDAALAVIRQLKEQDLIGVIAFDSQQHELAPLRALRENRPVLETDIPRLVENGGTDFFDALQSARNQLAAARVTRRHIILLTDGDTNRAAADHYPLMDDLVRDTISVTTIRIGDNDVNVRLLRDISEKTGGEFHHVEDVEMLPELLLRDTTRVLRPQSGAGEQFLPQIGTRIELLSGIDQSTVPAVTDYAYARLRRGAEALLYVARMERRDPVLAVWQHGLGRVAALTATAQEGAEAWPGWEDFGKLWSQLVQWAARAETPWDYALDVQRHHGQVELSVRAFDPVVDEGTLVARLVVSENETHDVTLMPRGPRLYTAALPRLPGGRYAVSILKRRGDREIQQYTSAVSIPSADEPAQEEHFGHGPNRALLAEITEATGGKLNPTAHELCERTPGRQQTMYSLDVLLFAMAMLLFLADVAVRRLTAIGSSVLLSCLLFASLSQAADGNENIAARVNGVAIRKAAVREVVLGVIAASPRVPSSDGIERIEHEARESLIELELLHQEAKARKMSVSPAEVESEITRARSRFASAEDFERAMQQSGLTEEQLRANTEKTLLTNRLLEEVVGDVHVNEVEVRRFYRDANPHGEPEPPSDVRQRIVRVLEDEKKRRRRDAFVAELRGKAKIEIVP